MSLEVWEHSFKGTNKEIRVPLSNVINSPEDAMLDVATSAQRKITIADKMFQNKQTTFKGHDNETYEIVEQNFGDRRAVGVKLLQDKGAAKSLLAGLIEKNGDVSRQRNAKNVEIDIESDWSKIHGGAGLRNETLLPANDRIAELYMEAREGSGKIQTGDQFVGTGFFLNSDGLFASVYHVTNDDTEVGVKTGDGQWHDATVLEKDPANDTVLLQVHKNFPDEKFTALKVGPFENMQPGDQVLACGFGEGDELHCSPGVFDSTLQQKDIKVKVAPGEKADFDPERLLVHAKQHTVNGDSGGLEFNVKDGTVRLQIDMTDNSKSTVTIPADKVLDLETRELKPPVLPPAVQDQIDKNQPQRVQAPS
jgi:hypothetical protein